MVDDLGGFDARAKLKQELEGLRNSLHQSFLTLFLGLPVLWFVYVWYESYQAGAVDVAVAVALVCALVSLAVRRQHARAGRWAVLVGLVTAHVLVCAAHPREITVAAGVVVVVLCNALLGSGASALLALVDCVACATVAYRAGGLDTAGCVGALTVYAMVWGGLWFSNRPIRVSVSWALNGWERARESLDQVRDRRGEVYRALRALEEATYRIERMNHELVVARVEAESARASKARFASTVSHELRGPLSIVVGFSRLMVLAPERYSVPLPEDYYADVDAIYRNAAHLSELVDDILDLSQIEAERLPVMKDWVDLEEDVCRQSVAIVEPLASRKGIGIHVDLEGGIPQVLADAVRLRQVLLNLLTNAIRHTDAGSIIVATELCSDHVIVTVSDTGVGIPEGEMATIFDEFRQGKKADSGSREGSGLGLSISHRLVSLHGGKMWVESSVGEGSSFHFSIPLPGRRPIASVMEPELSPVAMDSGVEICVLVGFSADLVRLFARYLDGYRVLALADSRELGRVAHDVLPRAILADHAILASVCQAMAQEKMGIPVFGIGTDPESPIGSGNVVAHLIKPVAPEMLTSLMHDLETPSETVVLIVDDEPDAVRMLEATLVSLPRPYRVLNAYSGEEVLLIAQRERPDVIFMDLVMPGVGGLETIKKLKGIPELAEVPIIIVSAQDASENAIHLPGPITLHSTAPISITTAALGLKAFMDAMGTRVPEAARTDAAAAPPAD